jgi:hypothetical protein
MPNIVTYLNFDSYLQRTLKGDLIAIKYMFDLFDNPLSFIHKDKDKDKYKNKKDLVINSLLGFKKLKEIESNKKLKSLFDDKLQAASQNGFHLKTLKFPYISVNNSIYKNLKVEFLFLCDGYDENNEIKDFYDRNNCYAARMVTYNKGRINTYFWINEVALINKLTINTYFNDTITEGPLLKVCNFVSNATKPKELLIISDFKNYNLFGDNIFDLEGVYLGSEFNHLFNFNYLNKTLPRILNIPQIRLTDCTTTIFTSLPNWEDIELELEN